MPENHQPVKITDNVHWVGAIDWNIRDFHGYLTGRGTTYNAYLILGQKNILIDTVKHGFEEELLARISKVIAPEKIDIIISNHSELDHTGALPAVIDTIKPEAVYASKMGVKTLNEHFNRDLGLTEVANGSSLDFGGVTLTFYETRMLHWPDSMFTYHHQDGILFSQDGFGMHLAGDERFDDEIDMSLLEKEAAKYYANILLPYTPIASKLLDKLTGIGLEFKMIAPDHGPVWRTHPDKILALYHRWAQNTKVNKAVIIYDSMWGSTEKMARAVAEGLQENGTKPILLSLKEHHRSDAAAEILEAGALLVGSPTLNSNLYPTVADVLSYIDGLRPPDLIGAAFGSFGWNSKAVELVEQWLEGFKVEIAVPAVKVKYVPNEDNLEVCRDLGRQIADRLKERGL